MVRPRQVHELHGIGLAVPSRGQPFRIANDRGETQVLGYARVALAPWFVLAGIIPLAFLLYRRNF